ncbi:MAG: hypothetical protein WCZ47_04485 [Bacilli bacterium]|jgi:hypothetical protein|nr:hypothetical protein [Bacilli bacterium]
MLKFFKFFGQGLLYTLLLPFLLAFLALFAVYSVLIMVFYFFKMIILFFAGRNIFKDFPEDIEAKEIIEQVRSTKAEKEEKATQQPPPPTYVFPFPSPYGFYPNPNQPPIDQKEIKEVESKPIEIDEDKK